MLLALGSLVVVGGCTSVTPAACATGARPMVSDWLYFGTARPAGKVSADDWQDFLQSTVTPRFPNGFTVVNANGQWKSSGGPIIREATYLLNVLHAGDERAESGIRDLMAAYKTRFQQEAVLRSRQQTCASF